jgi:SAM-dependent methyltransferase
MAQLFSGARVLAVDLSLASLAYAARKTRELGLGNITYAQADIVNLGSLGRTFDLVEASGVLHHLVDPMAGWGLLLSMLRPAGLMRVALYSKIARRDIVEARKFIAERNYAGTADDIRRFRQDLMAFPDGTPLKKVCNSTDFFTTSMCRDLLFHVQETGFDLDEIGSWIREQKLLFLGFEVDTSVMRSFRSRFAGAESLRDLQCWKIFEEENPDTFGGMYTFWIQGT